MVYLFHIPLTSFTIEFTEHVRRERTVGEFSSTCRQAPAYGLWPLNATSCIGNVLDPNQILNIWKTSGFLAKFPLVIQQDGARGDAVVKAPRYEPAVRGFDSR